MLAHISLPLKLGPLLDMCLRGGKAGFGPHRGIRALDANHEANTAGVLLGIILCQK